MPNESATLWEVELTAKRSLPDPAMRRAVEAVASIDPRLRALTSTRGFLIETTSDRASVESAAQTLLVDHVIEQAALRRSGEVELSPSVVTIMRKPGVMDPVASSAERALADAGLTDPTVRQFRRIAFSRGTSLNAIRRVASKILANEAV